MALASRTLLVLVFSLVAAPILLAQSSSISGIVRDESNQPMAGVAVQIRSLKKGAYSKSDGSYLIDKLPAGSYSVEASMIGYQTYSQKVNLKDDEQLQLNIKMTQMRVKLGEVQVTASRRKQEQSDTRTSVITVDPQEAKFKAGAGEDVLRTLQTMPGVVAPNDFSSQLVVRGSGPDQNLILMDNIELFNPYRLYGFVSMFNPETVSGITLLTGGFGARYSDRLSAVLDVTNRDGNRDKGWIGAKLNMSITNANLVLEGALPFMNGSWLVSSRRTYYDLIAGPIARSSGAVDGDVAFPNFQDFQAKLSFIPATNHKISLNYIRSRDNTEFRSGASRNQADSISIVDNTYDDVVGTQWLWSPTKNYVMTTGISYYSNTGTTSFGGSGGSQFIIGSSDVVSKTDFAKLQDSLRAAGLDIPTLFSVSGNTGFAFKKTSIRNEHSWRIDSMHTVDAGLLHDWIHTAVIANFDFDPRLKALQQSNPRIPALPESFENGVDYIRSSAYVQDNIRVSPQLNIQAGLRFDFFALLSKAYVAPRISASYALTKNATLRAAWGQYYQSPGYEKLFDAQVFLDFSADNVSRLKAEKATHYVIGYDQMLSDEWQFKTEAYYKDFQDLILPKRAKGTVWQVEKIPGLADSVYRTRAGWTTPVGVVGDSLTTIPVNSARGASYGIEFMLQKVASVGENTIYGWVSYALAIANRYQDGLTIPFNYDRRHNFNIVGGAKLSDWLEVNLTFSYGTGFPWTKAKGIKPRIVIVKDTVSGVSSPRIDTDWRGVVFDVDRGGLENINQGRLPDYYRADIRFTTPAHWFGWKWSWYLDVINVTNHSNIIAEQQRVDRSNLQLTVKYQSMLPILPTLGFSVQW